MPRKGLRSSAKAKAASSKTPRSSPKGPEASEAPPAPSSRNSSDPPTSAEVQEPKPEVSQSDTETVPEEGASITETKELFGFKPVEEEDDDEDEEFSPEVYGHMHRMILQGFLSAGFLDLKGVKRLFCEACKAAKKIIDYDVLTSPQIMHRTMRVINAQIEPFDMAIKNASCEISGAKFYAYLLTYRAQVLQFQTCFTKMELAFFHTIVDVIIRTNEFKLTFWECIGIRQYVDEEFTQKQAEEFMGRMIALQYFTRASPLLGQGDDDYEITLGFRTIRELELTFRTNYLKVFTDCGVCRIILVNGVQCSGCLMTLHRACLKKYLRMSRVCEECGTDWANTELRMRRRPSETDSDKENCTALKPKGSQRQALTVSTGVKNNDKKNKRKADVDSILMEPFKGIVPVPLGHPVNLTVASAWVSMDKQSPGSSPPPGRGSGKSNGNGGASTSGGGSGKKGKKGRGSPPKSKKAPEGQRTSEPSSTKQSANKPSNPPTSPGPDHSPPPLPPRPKKGNVPPKSFQSGGMDAEMGEPVPGPSREITGAPRPGFAKPPKSPPSTLGNVTFMSSMQSELRESDDELDEAELFAVEGGECEEGRGENLPPVEEYDSDFFEADLSNKDVDMDTANEDSGKALEGNGTGNDDDGTHEENAGSDLEDVELGGDEEEIEEDDITARFEEQVTISGGGNRRHSVPIRKCGDDEHEAGEMAAGPTGRSRSPPETLDPEDDESREEDEDAETTEEEEEEEEVSDEQQEEEGSKEAEEEEKETDGEEQDEGDVEEEEEKEEEINSENEEIEEDVAAGQEEDDNDEEEESTYDGGEEEKPSRRI